MADTETLTITDVSDANDFGWVTVSFEEVDDATTKDKDVAKAAFQARGSEAEVVINEQQNGNFLNRYLNEVNGVKQARPKKGAGGGRSSGTTRAAADPDKDKRISAQWALGRAVEATIAKGNYDLPFSQADLAAIKETAESLAALREKLTKS